MISGMTDQQLIYQIALTQIPKVGPKLAKNLIAYAGGVEQIFNLDKRELLKVPMIGDGIADQILSFKDFTKAEKELERSRKKEVKCVTFLEEHYPYRLKHFEDAPLVLFYKGNLDFLNTSRTVAIVGTRKPTEYGKNMVAKIIDGLKALDVTIISGLAYGIDTFAHRKSVEIEIPTFGIMGNGFNNIYPAANKNLAAKMVEQGGLMTEFPMDMIPNRENFPMRNRIIAGLSDAVIVAESKASGGSIITADIANDYNKDVFAIPGRVHDETSEGCNNLIKQNRAHLLQSAKDIAYIMRWEENQLPRTTQTQLFLDLSDDERTIIEAIKNNSDISIDQLSASTDMNLSMIAAHTLSLEFKGLIRSLPGKRFTLV